VPKPSRRVGGRMAAAIFTTPRRATRPALTSCSLRQFYAVEAETRDFICAETGWHSDRHGRLKQVSQLAQRGQLGSAVTLLKSTVAAYPKSHTAWGFLGKGLGDMKDYAGAEDALQKAIALAPSLDKAEHWFYVGVYRQEQRKFKEAAEAYRTTLELRPQDAEAHFSLGACLEATGDHEGAAEAFRQALRHRPDMAKARERLENRKK
jgi:tetratricopeptide (TPR) repeat protein